MIFNHRTIADLLTGSRIVAAVIVLGAAFVGDPQGHLPWVIALLMGAWTTDLLDGWVARRSGCPTPGWMGRHDLAIDAMLAAATLVYLVGLGWLAPLTLMVYLVTVTLIWLMWRSHWVWNGFTTGSHLIALGSLLPLLPGLGQIVLAWGALMLALGQHRIRQFLQEMRALIQRAQTGTQL